MGPLENILGMIPGMGKQLKNVNIDDRAFMKVEAIINSMTLQERRNYVILNGSRKKRIAAGSGTGSSGGRAWECPSLNSDAIRGAFRICPAILNL
jgi:signal recognition particle subunit SRP54